MPLIVTGYIIKICDRKDNCNCLNVDWCKPEENPEGAHECYVLVRNTLVDPPPLIILSSRYLRVVFVDRAI